MATVNRLPIDKGVVITHLAPGSPADKAGLEVGDVITHFKGEEITTAGELIQGIHSSRVEEEVEITFVRGSVTTTTHARLIQSPPPSK